jgi:hypothetical protein
MAALLRRAAGLVAVTLLTGGTPGLWALPSRLPTRPFTFVYGLSGVAGQQTLQHYGLTTHYMALAAGDITRLDEVRAEIRQAAGRGLMVVVGLPTHLTEATDITPGDPVYYGRMYELISCLVGELADEAGITAWATADYLERQLKFSDEDFRHYLQARYPTLDDLNAAWGSHLPTWAQITLKTPESLDAGATHQVGRAMVMVADYKAAAFGEVMAQWLAVIRAVDGQRPVLTGRISLYRSLLSVPEGYDVVCVSMPPSVLEADYGGHNVHALDMARRGGQVCGLSSVRAAAAGDGQPHGRAAQ